ncbi:TOMM precursor leader peptide-binding protein [Kitasatospora sp. NPDC056531]|uniref:TOMM precursor leader peptide-binding protein n=1 Tax=Kitasatospora sp. NPDC056531 TaxID=3345856 RepID=UPI003673FD5C
MRTVLRFKRFLCAEVVPGDGVYLFSEGPGQFRLQGRLAELLAPLLDGKHDRQEIGAALAGTVPARSVDAALDRLIAAGHVVEVDADADPRAGGYWELQGLHGDRALEAVAARTLGVTRLGQLPDREFEAVARDSGLRLAGSDGREPDLDVVLVDDYLNPGLADHNRRAIETGRPWLLAKTIGSTVWVGPVFEPGQTACWRCLEARLSANRMVLTYLQQRSGRLAPSVTSLADLQSTRRLGDQLAVLRASQWLAGAVTTTAASDTSASRQTEVVTVDTLTLQSQRHILTRRPQCPDCGDPRLQAELQRRPVTLTSRPKRTTGDGGHRAKSPDQLVATYEPLISPITGPVKHLIKVPGTVEGLYTYHAGQNFAVPMAHVGDLRAGLRSAAAGKGMSDVQAKASAIAEAIERSSGLYKGDEARIRTSYLQLGADAIAPNELHQFSERQFAERAEWNARGSHFQRVCDPFDPAAEIDWTPVWSLTREQMRYLPTASLFFGYPTERGKVYAGADSNGNAAGTCVEDAILQGFMELVERDSVAIWWYNMLRRPAIDLSTFDEPYFRTWQERYTSVNRETWVLDVTTDLGIPTVVAVSRRIDKPTEDILIAFGAHFDVTIAIARAMAEMNQFLPAVVDVTAESEEYAFPDPDQQRWWKTATVENQPYLLPSDEPARTAADYTDPSTADLAQDVRLAQRIVEDAGMEMLVLDQTRPDVGLPVVKVIVPGMRHFWTRYAPGRLYDVPVRMGLLTEPTAESDLNPIAMFL